MSVILDAVTCPRCQGHEFELSLEDEGSRGNAQTQGLFCPKCREWTTSRDRPPGLHLTQPRPAVIGGARPTDQLTQPGGPTDVRVWAWLLAELLAEMSRQLQPGGTQIHDTVTKWLQQFHASEHGTPPQELIPALQHAAKGGS